MKKCFVLLVAMMHLYIAYSQTAKEKSAAQTIHLAFKNMTGDSLLQTGVVNVNAFGEPFIIRAFKYYISNIQLQYADDNIYKLNIAPHLVNEADSATRQLSFAAPAGTITSIHFLLGVDSMVNTTGVQTGDLDPAKGMFWVWNTGYIMAKLEGTSAVAKSPGRQFSYDIGGYKKDENAAREITLPVSTAARHHQASPTFIIKADVLKWFKSEHDIKISDHPMCHEPGILAMNIADNYGRMFSISME